MTVVVTFAVALRLCLKVLPPFICQSKSVTFLKAPTAPCMDGGKLKVLPSFTHVPHQFATLPLFKPKDYLQHLTLALLVLLCSDTGHDETLNAVTMPMVNNDMCSQIKGDAGESRICAGGRRGEGVCDVRMKNKCLHHERETI